MSINSQIIVRLAFRRGSNQIHVGYTQANNITLTGEVVWSTDLEVSTYQTMTTLNSENAVGKVAITCIPDENLAETIVDQINSIQEARPTNTRGNKYPFVFVKVRITDDVIFNQGLNNDPDRLTILGVEHIEVFENAPQELLELNKGTTIQPALARTQRTQAVPNNRRATNTISWYERQRQTPLNKMSEVSRKSNSNGRVKGLNLSSIPF